MRFPSMPTTLGKSAVVSSSSSGGVAIVERVTVATNFRTTAHNFTATGKTTAGLRVATASASAVAASATVVTGATMHQARVAEATTRRSTVLRLQRTRRLALAAAALGVRTSRPKRGHVTRRRQARHHLSHVHNTKK